MSHPKELLERIKAQLERDYPSGRFIYEQERTLREAAPARFLPDFSIRDLLTGNLVCLVEIGYTRPEKLKRYRELGIGDVRWYSKSGELMNDYHETVNVLRHIPSKQECFYYYLLTCEFACPECFDSWVESEKQEGREVDFLLAYEEAEGSTFTHCWISDCNRGLAISFCDECGYFEVHYSGQGFPLENPLIDLDFKNLSHFLYRQKIQSIDCASLLLSTYRQEWYSDWPLPPNKCCFESIEEFVKYWFDSELRFRYELMEPIEWVEAKADRTSTVSR